MNQASLFKGPHFETLSEAQERLKQNRDKGMRCPCCSRHVKVYNRAIHSTMARALIAIERYFRKNPGEVWLHAQRYLWSIHVDAKDFQRLEAWGLIERKPASVDEQYSGYWKITALGIEYVYCRISLPKKIAFYLNEPIGQSDERVTIVTSLGTKFDYYELMRATL